MRKNKILILALLVCLSIPVRAQNTDNNIIGIVVDKSGNPVYGASVNVEGGAVETRVETDKDGKFAMNINLVAGEYPVYIKFDSNDKQWGSETKVNVLIKSCDIL